MSTTGHENDIINVQGLKASMQKLKTMQIDPKVSDVVFDSSTGKIQKNINGVTSDVAQVYTRSLTYTKQEVNSLVSTPHQNYVTVTATSSTTNVTSLLPGTGSADTIYRVGKWNGSQYNANAYSEYAWNGSTYILLDTKNVGVDNVPTKNSSNFVKSGGVKNDIDRIAEGLDSFSTESSAYLSTPVNRLNGKIINQWGNIENNSSFYILIYDISKSNDVIVSGNKAGSTGLPEYALSNDINFSTTGSFVNTGSTSFPETHIDTKGYKYLAINSTDWEGVTYKISVNVLTYSRSLGAKQLKVLFIGDSISTANDFKWKGFLEQYKNVQYVRDTSNSLWAANAGIQFACNNSKAESNIKDDLTAGSSDAKHSIWYRCAYNRLGTFNFDKIFLFGGTNDANCIAHPNQWISGYTDIGTINDIPFVDTASSITSETVTDVFTSGLTLAQYIMGCILMLKRDFPNKEIIMASIYPNSYANVKYKNTDNYIGDEVAKLQVRIANKYGLKIVPWYWDFESKYGNSWDFLTIDGVHPSNALAWQMMQKVSNCMCLENRA